MKFEQRVMKYRFWLQKETRWHNPDLDKFDFVIDARGDVCRVGLDGSIVNTNCANEFEGCKALPIQWTGLTDKNGVDIYEGDVININNAYGDQDVCRVVFTRGAFKIMWKGQPIDISAPSLIFVIGNVFQNPELLEVTNE